MAPKSGGPFENPNLNKFLHALSTTPVGPSKQPTTTGGYTPANISGYIPNFSAAQKGALNQAGITPQQAVTSQKVLDILKEVNGQNAEITANGGQVPDTTHHHGIFSRAMDIISRPMYAMAEGSKELAESVTSGKSVGSDLAAFGHGALQGVEGKNKTDFIQVLQTAQDVRAAKKKGMSGVDAVKYAEAHPGFSGSTGPMGKIGGFALDVVGDPLTYTGIGVVSKGAKAAEFASEGSAALEGLNVASRLSPETKDLISGLKYAKGDMTKSAATAAEGKVGGIAERIAKAEGSHAFDKTLAENLKNESKAGTEEFYPVNDREILHLAKTAKANREQEVMANILDNYNKVTSQEVNRHLALKLPGGVKVAIPGIPNVDLVAAAAKGAATKVNPISRSMGALKKNFQTVAKAMPELHETRLQAFDFGMSQARMHGREIKRALDPLGKDGRTEAWTAYLNGHPSNQMIKLKDGSEVEATKWIGDRINNIKLANLENGWKAADWKPFLPPGLELKASKISQGGKMVDDPNWFTNSLKDWNIKDGGKAQWFIESAYHQLSSYKTMLENMGENFGAHLPETHSEAQLSLYKGLQDKGWVSPKGVPELSAHVFPPEVAHNIGQIVSLMKTEKEWNKFWRGWAKVQAPVKFMLTLPNPSFHIHNSIGDMFVNKLDDVMPKHYIMSGKVMKNRSKWFEQYNPSESEYPLLSVAGDPLKTAAETTGPNANLIKNTMRLRSADGKINSHITQAEVYAGYNKYGLRQNYATDLGLTEGGALGNFKGMIDKITSASEAREDYFRMSHFIALIEKNPNKAKSLDEAMNFAARRVRQTHFDYTDFTKFEKQVMSQIVPFYKWTRKALPLMSQVLITHPGDAALIPKSLRLISALTGNVDMTSNDTLPNLEGAIVPDWMRTSGYVPTGDFFSPIGDHNQTYGYLSNPLSDMFTQQFGGVSSGSGLNAGSINQTLMGMLSPLIKIPDELRQNKNSFTGAKIIRNDPGGPGVASQIGNYAASQVPIANMINRARKGKVDTPFNWLTGLSVHEDDPQRQLGELLRQRDVGRAILRKLRYQHGGHLSSSSSGWKNS